MKTQQERQELKIAKANHRQALKNKEVYAFKRDQLLMAMVESAVPA